MSQYVRAEEAKYIQEIRQESIILKNSPRYEKLKSQEDSLFKQFGEHPILSTAGGQRIIPTLNIIKAPLAYYYLRFNENTNLVKNEIFLETVVYSTDIERRQSLVLYVKEYLSNRLNEYMDWDLYISRSGNPKWANQFIASNKDTPIVTDGSRLLYYSIGIWANEFERKNKKTAYHILRNITKDTLFRSNKEHIYILHLLDSKQTQFDIIKYYDPNNYRKINYYEEHPLDLLFNITGIYFRAQGLSKYLPKNILEMSDFENKRVAKYITNLREKMNRKVGSTELKKINTAIFHLNPKQGKREFRKHLKEHVNGSTNITDNYTIAFGYLLKVYANTLCSKERDYELLKLSFLNTEKLNTQERFNIFMALYKKSIDCLPLLLALKEKQSTSQTANDLLNRISQFLKRENSKKSKRLLKAITAINSIEI